ncbi:MAG TPA: hypothetical protein VHF25_01595 [Nitriliruptorales bacterium]|nr:hypothetical protein [Nitriliruptorales bacterium]
MVLPDFSLVGAFSFGFMGELGILTTVLAVFTLMLADFFDTMGTAIALGNGGFLDARERLAGMNRVLLVDSLAAAAGGAPSASSATTYIESASGIEGGPHRAHQCGGRSVVPPGAVLQPARRRHPPEATAPALCSSGSS